jgi:hypothetical protein
MIVIGSGSSELNEYLHGVDRWMGFVTILASHRRIGMGASFKEVNKRQVYRHGRLPG